jgi:hypothetical protein
MLVFTAKDRNTMKKRSRSKKRTSENGRKGGELMMSRGTARGMAPARRQAAILGTLGTQQPAAQPAPASGVERLAMLYGVRMEDVRRFTHSALNADDDLLRERRLRDIARRVAAGTYGVDAEQIVDMAERRAEDDRRVL